MRTLKEHKKEHLNDPEFAQEYDALSEEYEIARQIIHARIHAGLTQRDLADKIGTRQSNISRIENGNYNPSIAMLKRIAEATGTKLKVAFR